MWGDAPTERGGYSRIQLSLLRHARGFGAAVTAREFFHAARRVDEFLFAREKRMASGADADFNIAPRRARVIDRAASANDIGIKILWMNARFHVWKRARNLRTARPSRKG